MTIIEQLQQQQAYNNAIKLNRKEAVSVVQNKKTAEKKRGRPKKIS